MLSLWGQKCHISSLVGAAPQTFILKGKKRAQVRDRLKKHCNLFILNKATFPQTPLSGEEAAIHCSIPPRFAQNLNIAMKMWKTPKTWKNLWNMAQCFWRSREVVFHQRRGASQKSSLCHLKVWHDVLGHVTNSSSNYKTKQRSRKRSNETGLRTGPSDEKLGLKGTGPWSRDRTLDLPFPFPLLPPLTSLPLNSICWP